MSDITIIEPQSTIIAVADPSVIQPHNEETTISVDEFNGTLTVEEGRVTIITEGVQGPPGASATTYEHRQLAPLDTWVITHNLNRNPSVTVVDSAGNKVYGEVQYINRMSLVVSFSAAFGGSAYLN